MGASRLIFVYMRQRSSPGMFPVIVATLLWASVSMTGYFAPSNIGPAAYGEVRMAVGGMALALLIGPGRMLRVLSKLPRKHLFVATIALALFQWSFFAALATAGVVITNIVSTAIAPLAAATLSALVHRHPPKIAWWYALGLSATGLVLILSGFSLTAMDGVCFSVLSGIAYMAFTYSIAHMEHLEQERWLDRLAPVAASLIFAALVLLPVAWSDMERFLSLRGMLVASYLGLAATALAYSCYSIGLGSIAPTTALALQLLQPIVAMTLGFFVLHEHVKTPVAISLLLFSASAILLIGNPPSVQRRDVTAYPPQGEHP